ncbi:hypothetical protein FHQ18_11045 [Deferribacter autotrophicus]|uniref:Uncharacterized protein n=1 Tax=Deferribacter autotrophicus TaxID=500465 RepID=A0A5A8F5G6_9BACT|nr:hypothetical protein [Deferribacter autotrophicus]KAA0257097.1 hypothetical protein FHQ18_11045 [Deferribacter autotrophicus]
MKIENSNLSHILSKELPPLKKGEVVNVKVIRLIDKNRFVVSIKGKLLKAMINSEITLSKFKAEVIKTEPFLELKTVKEPVQNLDAIFLKKIAVKFSKDEIFKFLRSFTHFDLKKLDKEEIMKLIKDSGLFFEKKIADGEDVSNDVKGLIYKDNSNLKDMFLKLQVNLLMHGEIFLPFKSVEYGIKDGEIKIKKSREGFYITIKTTFSKLGTIMVKLREFQGEITGTIFTESRFKELINQINIENVRLNWKELKVEEIEKEFDFDSKLISSLGHFETIV